MSDLQRVHHVLDKRMIMPLVMIILLILAAGLVYYYVVLPEKSGGAETSAYAGQPAQTPEQTAQGVGEAAAEEGPTYCVELVRSGEYVDEESCFIGLSDKNFNHEYCFGIDDTEGVDACLKRFADRTLKPEACMGLSEEQDVAVCLFNIAMEREQSGPCFDIPYQNGEFSENHCLFEIARVSGNADICGFLTTGLEPHTISGCRAVVLGDDQA